MEVENNGLEPGLRSVPMATAAPESMSSRPGAVGNPR